MILLMCRKGTFFAFCLVFISKAALAQQPKLMLPIGHTWAVNTATFSRDGKKIVTSSQDNTAKIWDAQTGRLLVDLKGHEQEVYTAFFSPDGKKIITASSDNSARVWDAQTGQALANLHGHAAAVNIAFFSPDGKLVVTASKDSTAGIWDVSTGKLQVVLKGHKKAVNSAAFSPDGKKVVTASLDNTAKIWDAQNGKLQHELKGHSKNVITSGFSPDGKKIITASADKTARVWDAQTGLLLADLKGHINGVYTAVFSPDGKKIVTASQDSTARIWDVQTGRQLSVLSGHTYWVWRVSFSPDGKKVLTASWDNTAKIWDAQTGRLGIDLKGHEGTVYSAVFSPDGKKIITASEDNSSRIWDARSGQLLAELKGHSEYVTTAVFSPDGKRMLTSPWNSSPKLWETQNARLLSELKGHTDVVIASVFSPDGIRIVTASKDSTAKVWDAQSGLLLADLKGHTGIVMSAVFSQDGSRIVTASEDSTARIWDVPTGQLVSVLKGHTDAVIKAVFSPDGKEILTASGDRTAKRWDVQTLQVQSELKEHTEAVVYAVFSSDGKKIVTASSDNITRVWDAQTNALLLQMYEESTLLNSAIFSPDGSKIFTAYWDRAPRIWDAQTGQLIAKLEGMTIHAASSVFSTDGKKAVTGTWENAARVWDAQTGRVISELKGHTAPVISAAFGAQDKLVITSSSDNTTRVWDAENGKELFSFISLDSTDYLVVDSNYRYDGTLAARKLLYFTCNSETIELDQLKDQLWVPNLAERILKKESINAKSLDELQICGLMPEVEETSAAEGTYRFKIKPRRGGLGETALFVNGIEIKRYHSSGLKKIPGGYELEITESEISGYFVSGRENLIAVKSFIEDNSISSRGVIIRDHHTRSKGSVIPNLYAVLVGVSDYKGDELDLKYAAKDAGDFSSAVAASARKLLNIDGKEHVFIYNLTTAQQRYLLPEKKSIKKVFEEIGRRATADDILLIFFAGHGIVQGEKKQFYFLTSDASQATSVSAVQDVGISTEELTEWMKPQYVKAQKRILIFDACNSGQMIRDFVKEGREEQGYAAARNDEQARQIRAIDKLNGQSGFFILSASASNQDAYEMSRYSQGLLTYSLLKAMKQQPDILERGRYLDVSRWFNAAKNTVTELTRETGARQQPQVYSTTQFHIGIVDEEVMAKIVLQQEKPLFTGTNLQNADESIAYDDLGLSRLLDKKLNDFAERDNDNPIEYVPNMKADDVWMLSGRYEVKGKNIIARVNIRQGSEAPKFRVELTGTVDDLDKLAAAVIEKAISLVK